MKKTAALAVVAGTVLATALAGAGTASAETKLWKACQETLECKLPSGFFPGGTISIDVDAFPVFPAQPDHLYTWRIGNCSGSGSVSEPARSWVCTLPASYYTLTTTAVTHHRNWSIGLRWG